MDAKTISRTGTGVKKMPRNGGGIYSKGSPSVVSGTTIQSAAYNTTIDDLVTDANAARPISAGGTGAANAADARTNLGGTATGVAVFTAASAAAARTAISISATNTPFTPAGNIAATNVQAALAELDTEKAALAGATFTGGISGTTGTFSGAVSGAGISGTTGTFSDAILGGATNFARVETAFTETRFASNTIYSAKHNLFNTAPTSNSDTTISTYTDYIGEMWEIQSPQANTRDIGKFRTATFYAYHDGSGFMRYGFGSASEFWNNYAGTVDSGVGLLALSFNGRYGQGGTAHMNQAIAVSALASNFRNSGGIGIDTSIGVYGRATNDDASETTAAYGGIFEARQEGPTAAALMPFAQALRAEVYSVGSGGITNATGLTIYASAGTAIAAWYGLRIPATGGAAFTANKWAVYSDADDQWYINGAVGLGATVPTNRLHVAGTIRGTNAVFLPGVAAATTASAANMFIDSATGELFRSTSARSGKIDIAEISEEAALRFFREGKPRSYRDRFNPGDVFVGYVADEVDEVAPWLVGLDEHGVPDDVRYPQVAALLHRAMQAEIADLRAQIAKLSFKK